MGGFIDQCCAYRHRAGLCFDTAPPGTSIYLLDCSDSVAAALKRERRVIIRKPCSDVFPVSQDLVALRNAANELDAARTYIVRQSQAVYPRSVSRFSLALIATQARWRARCSGRQHQELRYRRPIRIIRSARRHHHLLRPPPIL